MFFDPFGSPGRIHGMRTLFAALAVCVAGALPAAATESIAFSVVRDGTPIGTHRIDIARTGSEIRVEVAIDLLVKIAFVPVYRYTHRNREIWRDGRLQSIDTTTDDNGTPLFVRGRVAGNGVRVESSSGTFVAPADVIPTSYWARETVARDRLLDSQNGRLLAVSVVPETAAGGGPGTKYRVTGDLAIELWYDARDRLRRLAFDLRGARFEYRPIATIVPSGPSVAER